MSGSPGRDADENDRNWRRVALLLLLLLVAVIAGSGLTTFIGDDEPSTDDEVTPSIDLTPTGPDGGVLPTTRDTPDEEEPTATADPNTPTPTTRTQTPDDTPAESDAAGGGGGGPSGSVSLRAVGPTALFQYSGVAPGDSGREELVLRNAGTQSGQLVVGNVTVTDAENGIVSPEAAVDGSPDAGELSGAVEAVVTVTYPDGTTEYLYGTEDGARPLAAIAAAGAATGERLEGGTSATITVEWVIPATTGNEIQSDSLTTDFRFQLRATDG